MNAKLIDPENAAVQLQAKYHCWGSVQGKAEAAGWIALHVDEW